MIKNKATHRNKGAPWLLWLLAFLDDHNGGVYQGNQEPRDSRDVDFHYE